ncbi:hypothetical protein D3C73_980130 [compost metagenome]
MKGPEAHKPPLISGQQASRSRTRQTAPGRCPLLVPDQFHGSADHGLDGSLVCSFLDTYMMKHPQTPGQLRPAA